LAAIFHGLRWFLIIGLLALIFWAMPAKAAGTTTYPQDYNQGERCGGSGNPTAPETKGK
jgi:hypothetical protein